jgi:hypothetical protein
MSGSGPKFTIMKPKISECRTKHKAKIFPSFLISRTDTHQERQQRLGCQKSKQGAALFSNLPPVLMARRPTTADILSVEGNVLFFGACLEFVIYSFVDCALDVYKETKEGGRLGFFVS